MDRDTRLTQPKKRERIYVCDRCDAVKVYRGRVEGFDGSLVDHSWRGRYRFRDLKGAWERGEIDVTWHCMACQVSSKENNSAVIACGDWLHRFNKAQHRVAKVKRWRQGPTTRAAARTGLQEYACLAEDVAEPPSDSHEESKQQELMEFAQFGATLAGCIIGA